jgi:hypothetical protein
MNAPTGFRDRLRTELVELVEGRRPEPAPRRHRAWRFALPVGVTAAAAAAALWIGTPHENRERPVPTPVVVNEVGFRLEIEPDGIVEVALQDPAGAKGLERKLNELGFRAVVMVDDRGCTEPAPQIAVPAETLLAGIGDHGETRFRTSVLPPDAYLLIVYAAEDDQYPSDGPSMTLIAAVKTVPGCYKINNPAGFPTPR